MEGNISRVRAETDLRTIQTNKATLSGEAMTEVTNRLVGDLGETAKIKHNVMVTAEEGANQKFQSIMNR